MNNFVSTNDGGVSNSPPTNTKDGFELGKVLYEKEVKIDWFQVSFDFLDVKQVGSKNIYSLDRHSAQFLKLMTIFNRAENVDDLQSMPKGENGFLHGMYIDEHIKLSYGGSGKVTKFETNPLFLSMSGQGCRAFEMMGGSWYELFEYFIMNTGHDGYLKFGRIDIAIDDFTGNEITPYMIWPYIERKDFISPFRKGYFYRGLDFHTDYASSNGYTITLGSRGSNVLQIYDKRLERDANDQPDLISDIWYRYEMRFADDKARQVIDLYIESVKRNDSKLFMQFSKQILKSLLDLKIKDDNQKNRARWKTIPEWDLFLDSLDKIDLRNKNRVDSTLEKKVQWFPDSLGPSMVEFIFGLGEDYESYMNNTIANAKITRKNLNKINNYLRANGKPVLTLEEIEAYQKAMKDLIKNE
ncbi:MAG: replication initiation factor domain-containing protein [Acholeplasmataceae bacterium]